MLIVGTLLAALSSPALSQQEMQVSVGPPTRDGAWTAYRITVVHEGAAILAVLSNRTRYAALIVNGATVQDAGRFRSLGIQPFGHGISALRLAGLTTRDRVEIRSSSPDPIAIVGDQTHLAGAFQSGLGSGIFYGILVAIVLFQVVALFVLKDRTLIWFMVWVIAVFGIELARDDLLGLTPVLTLAVLLFLNFVAQVGYVGFACAYLKVWEQAPRLFWLLMLTNVATMGTPIVIAVTTRAQVPLDTIVVCNLVSVLMTILVALLRRRAGFMPAAYLAIGLLGSLLIFGGMAFREASGIQSPFLDRWAVEVGCTFDYLIFSLALLSRARFTVREQEVVEGRLREARLAAGHDPLTSLLNRRGLEESIKDVNLPATVLFIDIDGFKAINDTGGHGAGDDTLTVVARIIRHSVREQDAVARFGGDEFVVVLTGCADGAVADEIISRISSAVGFLLPLGADSGTRIGVSIGRAVLDENVPFAEALKVADAAAYRVKAEHHAASRKLGRLRSVRSPNGPGAISKPAS
jgi:two-component system, sensor histidine kinase LadS